MVHHWPRHILKKSQMGWHVIAFQLHAGRQLPSQPFDLWMLPLAIYTPWMTEPHNFPLLSPPFIRTRNEQYAFLNKCVFLSFKDFFFNVLWQPQESLNVVVFSVVWKKLQLKEAGFLMYEDVQWGLRAHLSVFVWKSLPVTIGSSLCCVWKHLLIYSWQSTRFKLAIDTEKVQLVLLGSTSVPSLGGEKEDLCHVPDTAWYSVRKYHGLCRSYC